MSDSVILVCAVFASLAFGVLLAYGVCQAVFALFRMRARRRPRPLRRESPAAPASSKANCPPDGR